VVVALLVKEVLEVDVSKCFWEVLPAFSLCCKVERSAGKRTSLVDDGDPSVFEHRSIMLMKVVVEYIAHGITYGDVVGFGEFFDLIEGVRLYPDV